MKGCHLALGQLARVLLYGGSILSSALGCAGAVTVTRVAGGQTIVGHFVPPEAYAAYARGVLAEVDGNAAAAEGAYRQAASDDPEDPEPWVRVGALRCRGGKTSAGEDALDHAAKLDPDYAPLARARASCRPASRAELERRAAALDPDDVGAPLAMVAADGQGTGDALSRLRALSVRVPHEANVWRALAVVARKGGAEGVAIDAMRNAVALDPASWPEAAHLAASYEAEGRLSAGRAVAGATLDAVARRPAEAVSLLGGGQLHAASAAVASLERQAFDEAIARDDEAALTRRATAARLSLGLAAERALLLGRVPMAKRLADLVVAADRDDVGGAWVRMALLGKAERPPPGAADGLGYWLAADHLAPGSRVMRDEPDPRDPRLAARMAILVEGGVVAAADVPPLARTLAAALGARRRPGRASPPPEVDRAALAALGPAWELVGAAVLGAGDVPARELASKLQGADDPIVVAARWVVSGARDPKTEAAVRAATAGDPIASALLVLTP